MSKACFKCGAVKPLADFYKHKMMADGHLNKCKECTKTGVKKHRQENESVREYDRRRGNRQTLEDLRRYRAENPVKYAAHRAVANAIKRGVLVKGLHCEVCSSDFHVEGHHDDYRRPLVVRWLCSRCHSQWHAEHGEALNP